MENEEERKRTVSHVPSQVTEAVDRVVRSRSGDEGLAGPLEPGREVVESVDHGFRVELNAGQGSTDVSEEEGVEDCRRGE